MTNIFLYIVLAVIVAATLVVSVQSVRDLVTDTAWFRRTKFGMNYHNRLNKVEILTEEEYFLLWNGKTVEV